MTTLFANVRERNPFFLDSQEFQDDTQLSLAAPQAIPQNDHTPILFPAKVTEYYNCVGDGTVRILKAGVYCISLSAFFQEDANPTGSRGSFLEVSQGGVFKMLSHCTMRGTNLLGNTFRDSTTSTVTLKLEVGHIITPYVFHTFSAPLNLIDSTVVDVSRYFTKMEIIAL